MAASVSPIRSPSTELADRLLAEGLVSMSAIARMLGELKGGRPVHPSTPYRWATRGVLLRDGSRLKLEAIVLSGRPVSTRAALLRFIAAQQPDDTTDNSTSTPLSGPARRRRDSENAGRELRKVLGGGGNTGTPPQSAKPETRTTN
jgi:hypothetical protein